MDQQPPAQTPPPPDPGPVAGWAPQPAAASPVTTAVRPTAVTAAAIVLMVTGVLAALLGLLMLLAGGLLSGLGGGAGLTGSFAAFPAVVGTFIAVVGGIFLVFGVLEVFSGIYLLPGRGWARITAIILSVLGGLVSLGGVLDARAMNGGVAIPLIFLVAYAFVIWAVSVHGRWFASRQGPSASAG